MKKFLPAVFVVLCVCLILFGVLGALRTFKSDGAQKEILTPGAHAEKLPEGAFSRIPDAGDMLTVAIPDSVPSQLKEYTGFTLSFNADNRTPNWVAWELLGSETDGPGKRESKFWQDESLTDCPDHRDYSRSGYDRGHMCPAADMKWSAEAMHDCFSLANIVPQDNSLNTGAWSTLEKKERAWAVRDSAILIVAGPIYSPSDTKRIGKAGVRVPGAFFKVLAAPFAEHPRGIAFVYPNMTAPGNMENYVMTIRDLEKITGYDFFCNMPQELQDAMEQTASFRDWNRR